MTEIKRTSKDSKVLDLEPRKPRRTPGMDAKKAARDYRKKVNKGYAKMKKGR